MPPSCIVENFLSSLPVVNLEDLWAQRQCDICHESFFEWAEKPLKLPCGHIFGSKCIAEWLSPTAVDLKPKNTCPICREVLFSQSGRRFWDSTSLVPGTRGVRLPVPLLTSAARGGRQNAIIHPGLLARLAEAQNRGSAGGRNALGPVAEALASLRAIIRELPGNKAGRETAESIPVSVMDDAVHSLAAQMGRLYEHHEPRIDEETTSISWDSEGPEVSFLRDPVWARWCEWQLQELVYMELNTV
ncbi:hypothetical protein HO173_012360 [Letharia columbiana]|uniref:RING-type domain-containing protein n=1 Tax=Letharia columbiana TaxID=112416 RepID=A0A8H6CNH3_9LECA|nr:uncharacterized protein HO173_012360 [Letharia columbiana]KAF6226757.1 hypothetical protein HO173_012360 [Letharia columbiana]